MRRTLLLTLLLLSSTFSFAQKAHEFGLRLYSFNDFGVVFKTGKKTALTRFSLVQFLGYNNETTSTSPGNDTKDKQSGFAIDIGREYRIALGEKFNLVIGPEAGYRRTNSNYEVATSKREYHLDEWSIGFILGGNYEFSDKFVVSAELVPDFGFRKGTSTYKYDDGTDRTDETKGTYFGLANTGASITLAYRLFKQKQE